MSEPLNYPLSWPVSVPRTRAAKRNTARFSQSRQASWGSSRERLSMSNAVSRLMDELKRLGARSVVISTNVAVRLDGLPRSGQRKPEDPGAAAYFDLAGEPHCMPCDRWDRVEDNVAAIAGHVAATRKIERYGVGSIAEAFTAFKALPAARRWFEILGVPEDATLGEIKGAYKLRAFDLHPDRNGDPGEWDELQSAYAFGLDQRA